MIQVALLDTNLDFTKKLKKALHPHSSFIKLLASPKYERLFNAEKPLHFDVVITTTAFFKEYFSQNHCFSSVFLIENFSDINGFSIDFQTTFFYRQKKSSYEKLVKNLTLYLYEMATKDRGEGVDTIFSSLGFNSASLGTKYLRQAVLACNADPSLMYNLEKGIFPHLSRHFGIPAENIKWNIEKSIKSMLHTIGRKKALSILDVASICPLSTKIVLARLCHLLTMLYLTDRWKKVEPNEALDENEKEEVS